MPDHQEMYLTLFSKVSDTIEGLQQAQAEMKGLHLDSTETSLHLLQPKEEPSAKKQGDHNYGSLVLQERQMELGTITSSQAVKEPCQR